jgi:hypothetical protein
MAIRIQYSEENKRICNPSTIIVSLQLGLEEHNIAITAVGRIHSTAFIRYNYGQRVEESQVNSD